MTYLPTPYHVSIPNVIWAGHGGRLVEWLKTEYGRNQDGTVKFKLSFVKNREGRVIPEQPVTICFQSADDAFLFKLTMDTHSIVPRLEEWFEQHLKNNR